MSTKRKIRGHCSVAPPDCSTTKEKPAANDTENAGPKPEIAPFPPYSVSDERMFYITDIGNDGR